MGNGISCYRDVEKAEYECKFLSFSDLQVSDEAEKVMVWRTEKYNWGNFPP